MIEFLTLFLGIVAGPQQVQVSVAENVAAVELRLDGVVLSRLDHEPWHFPVDLGPNLLPHRLEAVAFDAEGNEIDRASQALNVPRPAAEATLALVRNDGKLTGARIAWESTTARRPERIRAQLDGVDLPILDGDRIDLSDVDETEVHVLQVTLGFRSAADAQSLVLLGKNYVGETSADLTAWPLLLEGREPGPSQMTKWFASAGDPVVPVAIEKGPVSLVVVRAPGVERAIVTLDGLPGAAPQGGGAGIGPIVGRAVASSSDRQRSALPFGMSYRVRLLVSRSLKESGQQVDYDLFSVSPEITHRDGGLLWALSREVAIGGPASRLRVNDAVTSAGLLAAGSNQRRAVLLVLDSAWEDFSRFEVATVRGYLDALNVPLVVWRLGEGSTVAQEWGEGAEVARFSDLRRAWRDLEKNLARQRIVWLEGSHLPNAIQLAAPARGSRVTATH